MRTPPELEAHDSCIKLIRQDVKVIYIRGKYTQLGTKYHHHNAPLDAGITGSHPVGF